MVVLKLPKSTNVHFKAHVDFSNISPIQTNPIRALWLAFVTMMVRDRGR